MFDDDEINNKKNKTIKLYRKNEKGEVNLKEISRGMYSDSDSFQEALDHWFGEGYYDSYQEAKEGPDLIKNNLETLEHNKLKI